MLQNSKPDITSANHNNRKSCRRSVNLLIREIREGKQNYLFLSFEKEKKNIECYHAISMFLIKLKIFLFREIRSASILVYKVEKEKNIF